MTELRISNKVCGLLAQQLASEKAETFRHLAIVKSIQNTIIEKKTSLVRNLLMGKSLKIRNRVYVVLEVTAKDYEDIFTINLMVAEEPYSATKDINLTKMETKCVAKYDEYLLKCIDHGCSKDWQRKVQDTAIEIYKLKHGILLVKPIFRTFEFEDAVAPSFFKQTDIFVNGNELYKGKLIEETIIG
jgi:hypothetical protein